MFVRTNINFFGKQNCLVELKNNLDIKKCFLVVTEMENNQKRKKLKTDFDK